MFQESLGMRLRGAYLTFHRQANAHFEPFGLTADQFIILMLLAEEEGLTQRAIVERASSDANTIGEMLLRLEKKKLICRRPHPSDGRARCVYLTPLGRRTQGLMQASWQVPLDKLDASFSPRELKQLNSLLARIPTVVKKVPMGEEVA